MPSTPAATARPPLLFAGLLLAALTALTFGPGLDGPFVGVEARAAIRDNPHITWLWQPLAGLASHAPNLTYRPSLSASFALNQAICGPTPRCLLAGNLLLHLAAGILLLLVLQSWLSQAHWPTPLRRRALPLAAVIAALWSMHPLQTEVVTYLPGRAEGLAGTLVLASLYAIVRWGTSHRHLATAAAIGTALLAAGSDSSAMLVLPLALAFEMGSQGQSVGAALRRRPDLYLGLAVAAGVALVFAGLRSNLVGMPTIEAWAAQPGALLRHVLQFLWPATLQLEIGVGGQPPWWHSAAALPILGAAGIFWRRQPAGSPLTLAAGLIVLAWLPYALLPGPVVIAERQAYLASIGMAALLVFVGEHLRTELQQTTAQRGAVFAAAAAFALALVGRTQERIGDYRHDLGAVAPAARDAASARHLAYLRDRPTAAIREWEELLAAGKQPGSGLTAVLRDTYLHLARQYVDAGAEQAAIPHLQRALALAPERVDVHYDLGRILAHGADPAKAEAHLQAAVALAPEHADAHLSLGELMAQRGDLLAAREHFAFVRELAVRDLETHPDDAETWCRLGRARRGLEQPERALEALAHALATDPRHPASLRGRLATLLDLGRTDEARQALTEAQHLLPHDPELQQLAERAGAAQ